MKTPMKSMNHFKSVIQTSDGIIGEHGGGISVRIPSEKVETTEGEESKIVVTLPQISLA